MGAVGVDGARLRWEIDPGEFSSFGIAIRRSDKDNGRRQKFGTPDRRVEICWPVGIADERTTPSDGRLPPWPLPRWWRLWRCAQALADSPLGIPDCASRIPKRVLRDRVPSRHRPHPASANPLCLACVVFPLQGPAKAIRASFWRRRGPASPRGSNARCAEARLVGSTIWRALAFSCQNSGVIVGADAGDRGSPPASSSGPARDDCHARCGRVPVRDLDPGRR